MHKTVILKIKMYELITKNYIFYKILKAAFKYK